LLRQSQRRESNVFALLGGNPILLIFTVIGLGYLVGTAHVI